MERYKTVEEFLNDYIFSDVDNKVLAKLQSLAIRALCYGKEKNTTVSKYGYISVKAQLSGLYTSEKKILTPWRDTAVTWKDSYNTVWSIYYEPAKYKGKPDIIRVAKEYFFE